MKSYKITQPMQNLFLGATSPDEKTMANNYRKNANTSYVKWAVNQIVNWQNQEVAAPVFHIHGNADRMFPVKKVKADAIITNGKHLMIMTKANEVSMAINQFLG